MQMIATVWGDEGMRQILEEGKLKSDKLSLIIRSWLWSTCARTDIEPCGSCYFVFLYFLTFPYLFPFTNTTTSTFSLR
ncbi:hypothetical protein, unlikely [Trypanosoma brucei brucei TREU927]|uniref:Uncharacterized protein n=1 Tax=Trypanosoma brucei brucei (strain 927/4 GUTat10.1) TaxID=185431 RepID=Q38FS3_TRYB2|nr:hypothetical protein, unlikely [Trypanosoma brucei brucei TREU927]EAN76347.1 hypothetical protein, unlikely [Trypanosoma brucei brucei TREU927]